MTSEPDLEYEFDDNGHRKIGKKQSRFSFMFVLVLFFIGCGIGLSWLMHDPKEDMDIKYIFRKVDIDKILEMARKVGISSGSKTDELTTIDTEENMTPKDLGTLPSWNLKLLYESTSDPKINNDYEFAFSQSNIFVTKYKGKVASLNSAQMLEALNDFQNIASRLSKIYAYAALNKATHASDESVIKFYSNIVQKYSVIMAKLTFFSLELSKLSDAKINELTSTDKGMKEYKYFLDRSAAFKKHMLSDETEMYATRMMPSSSSAWQKLYDMMLSKLRFNIGGEEKILPELFKSFTSPKAEVRNEAADALHKTLAEKRDPFVVSYNALVAEKNVDDEFRKFKDAISQRNLNNDVDDAVVDALVLAVAKSASDTTHRFFSLRSMMLNGSRRMNYYDKYAPPAFVKEETFTWEEARSMVLNSYHGFSGKMSTIAQEFFADQRIDAGVYAGKESGAFCMAPSPSVKPYVMLNYNGTLRDVSTLAHELGHGIHFVLASKQSYLNYNMPVTVAEMASLFGEALLFDEITKSSNDKVKKASLLLARIDDLMASIIRQISFLEFETTVYKLSKGEELDAEQIGKIWLDTQRRAYGPSVIVDESCANDWMYVSHFFHQPFYVYAYAFDALLVESLHTLYKDETIENFEDKYIQALSEGGSRNYIEILKPFGVDPRDPNFWQKGMEHINDLVDQLSLIVETSPEIFLPKSVAEENAKSTQHTNEVMAQKEIELVKKHGIDVDSQNKISKDEVLNAVDVAKWGKQKPKSENLDPEDPKNHPTPQFKIKVSGQEVAEAEDEAAAVAKARAESAVEFESVGIKGAVEKSEEAIESADRSIATMDSVNAELANQEMQIESQSSLVSEKSTNEESLSSNRGTITDVSSK